MSNPREMKPDAVSFQQGSPEWAIVLFCLSSSFIFGCISSNKERIFSAEQHLERCERTSKVIGISSWHFFRQQQTFYSFDSLMLFDFSSILLMGSLFGFDVGTELSSFEESYIMACRLLLGKTKDRDGWSQKWWGPTLLTLSSCHPLLFFLILLSLVYSVVCISLFVITTNYFWGAFEASRPQVGLLYFETFHPSLLLNACSF